MQGCIERIEELCHKYHIDKNRQDSKLFEELARHVMEQRKSDLVNLIKEEERKIDILKAELNLLPTQKSIIQAELNSRWEYLNEIQPFDTLPSCLLIPRTFDQLKHKIESAVLLL